MEVIMNRFQKIMLLTAVIGSVGLSKFLIAMDKPSQDPREFFSELAKMPSFQLPTEKAFFVAKKLLKDARALEDSSRGFIDAGNPHLTPEEKKKLKAKPLLKKKLEQPTGERRQAQVGLAILEKQAAVAKQLELARTADLDSFIKQLNDLIVELERVPGELSVPTEELYRQEAKKYFGYATILRNMAIKMTEERVAIKAEMSAHPVGGECAITVAKPNDRLGSNAPQVQATLLTNNSLLRALCVVGGAAVGAGLSLLGLSVVLPAAQIAVDAALFVGPTIGGLVGLAATAPLAAPADDERKTKTGATKRLRPVESE